MEMQLYRYEQTKNMNVCMNNISIDSVKIELELLF